MGFQYLTPAFHKDILECIVSSLRDNFIETILTNPLTISLRCDGCVNRSQVGSNWTRYPGCHISCYSASLNTIGKKVTTFVFDNISLVVTDGASVNFREKGGFCTLFENKYWDTSNDTKSVSLLKIWCAAYCLNLARKDVNVIIPKIQHLLKNLSGFSSFFHTSALRTRELEIIAKENNCALLRIPKVFKIKWTTFSALALSSILTSCNAFVLYMDYSVEPEIEEYGQFLKDEYELKFLVFTADVLTVFS